MQRRSFLAGTAALMASPSFAATANTSVMLLGQALIEHPLPPSAWPARESIAQRLSKANVCFTNFETVIKGARAGTPTREAETLHAATPAVLDTLKAVHVNVLSTSNNHAFDLNTGGILDTIDAIKAAGIPFAGTGTRLAEAATPAVVKTPQGSVAFVCFASGKIRDGGMATETRAGVNELRRSTDGAPHPEDASRILKAITDAKRAGHTVVVYQHNHYWEPEQVQVPVWLRTFAHQCIDAGGAAFVGHGVPMLQGIEVYKTAPIFFGLGNFIFQTEKAVGAYGPESWQSVMVDCTFTDGRCHSAQLIPIVLNEIGLGGPSDMASRGAPTLADPTKSRSILQHLAQLSKPFGTSLDINTDGSGTLKVL